MVVEAFQRGPDPGATGPVGDRTGRRGQGSVGIARRELGSQPRQACPEREDLDAAAGASETVGEHEQGTRVRRHRARHVAEEHDPARNLQASPEAAGRRVAADGDRSTHSSPHVEACPTWPLSVTARATVGPKGRDRGDENAEGPELVCRDVGEVLRAQRLRRRPAGGGVGCRLIAARHGLCRTTPGRLSKRRRGGRDVPAGAREPRSEEIVEDSEIVTVGDESLS